MHCRKLSPEFKGQRSKVKVTRDKKRNYRVIPLTMHSRACAVGRTQQAATEDTTACRPGVTGYAGGKIRACCLVFVCDECIQDLLQSSMQILIITNNK